MVTVTLLARHLPNDLNMFFLTKKLQAQIWLKKCLHSLCSISHLDVIYSSDFSTWLIQLSGCRNSLDNFSVPVSEVVKTARAFCFPPNSFYWKHHQPGLPREVISVHWQHGWFGPKSSFLLSKKFCWFYWTDLVLFLILQYKMFYVRSCQYLGNNTWISDLFGFSSCGQSEIATPHEDALKNVNILKLNQTSVHKWKL